MQEVSYISTVKISWAASQFLGQDLYFKVLSNPGLLFEKENMRNLCPIRIICSIQTRFWRRERWQENPRPPPPPPNSGMHSFDIIIMVLVINIIRQQSILYCHFAQHNACKIFSSCICDIQKPPSKFSLMASDSLLTKNGERCVNRRRKLSFDILVRA